MGEEEQTKPEKLERTAYRLSPGSLSRSLPWLKAKLLLALGGNNTELAPFLVHEVCLNYRISRRMKATNDFFYATAYQRILLQHLETCNPKPFFEDREEEDSECVRRWFRGEVFAILNANRGDTCCHTFRCRVCIVCIGNAMTS